MCDQHRKEDIRGGVDNLKVKQEVQDPNMKKSGRRIAKKRTKGKAAAGTGQGGNGQGHRHIFPEAMEIR